MFVYERNEKERIVPTVLQISSAPTWAQPILQDQAEAPKASAPGLVRALCCAFREVPEYRDGEEVWLMNAILGILPKRVPKRARPAGQKATITDENRAAVVDMYEAMDEIVDDDGNLAYVAKYRVEDIEQELGLSKADVAMAIRNHLGKKAGGFTDSAGRVGDAT